MEIYLNTLIMRWHLNFTLKVGIKYQRCPQQSRTLKHHIPKSNRRPILRSSMEDKEKQEIKISHSKEGT